MAGTFEKNRRACIPADSYHYVAMSRATEADKRPCGENKQVVSISVIDGRVEPLLPMEGATTALNCTCMAGFYPFTTPWASAQPTAGPNASSTGAESGAEGTVNHTVHGPGASSSLICKPCPAGASCRGGLFLPTARPGYAQLAPNSTDVQTYTRCGNANGCVGDPALDAASGCDCLGGLHESLVFSPNTTRHFDPAELVALGSWHSYVCGSGYAEGSPLCSQCAPGYGRIGSKCWECSGWSGASPLYALLVVVVLYPFSGWLLTHLDSLGVILNTVQFLGFYSDFKVPWTTGVHMDVYSWLIAFEYLNFDVDLVHLTCYGLDYEQLWIVQAIGVPLVFPVCWLIYHAAAFALHRLTIHGTTTSAYYGPIRLLLAAGWLPRRPLCTCRDLVDSFVPGALLFGGMYVFTGMEKALEPFACLTADNGVPYLAVAPSVVCWQGTHLRILLIDLLPLLIWVVSFPLLTCYVLFRLVPKYGVKDERLSANFGFLWGGYEDAYYYWCGRTHACMQHSHVRAPCPPPSLQGPPPLARAHSFISPAWSP